MFSIALCIIINYPTSSWRYHEPAHWIIARMYSMGNSYCFAHRERPSETRRICELAAVTIDDTQICRPVQTGYAERNRPGRSTLLPFCHSNQYGTSDGCAPDIISIRNLIKMRFHSKMSHIARGNKSSKSAKVSSFYKLYTIIRKFPTKTAVKHT